VISAGAVAAQLGTAFLLAHEAGPNPGPPAMTGHVRGQRRLRPVAQRSAV